MDAVSYSHSAKQAQRIEKFIKNPDSNSGIVTVPKVIGAGENVTIPAGRVAVLPNVQVDGTLNIEGEVFIPSGATFDDLENQIDTKVTKVTSTDNAIVRFNGATGEVQNSSVMIDDSGNVGIGVTPSAWGSSWKSLDLLSSSITSYATLTDPYTIISNNAYISGSSSTLSSVYKNNGSANSYNQGGGAHVWRIAPSGTAGNPITWTNAMTLGANGNLLVGTTTDNGVDKLQVNGNITASGSIRYNDINNIAWTASPTGLDTLDFYVNSTGAHSGDVMEITCVFNHYGLLNFGCVWKGIVANGQGGLTSAIIINNSSEQGGSFSITRINSTQLKITKNAGTYGGGGMLMVKVSGTNISKGN